MMLHHEMVAYEVEDRLEIEMAIHVHEARNSHAGRQCVPSVMLSRAPLSALNTDKLMTQEQEAELPKPSTQR